MRDLIKLVFCRPYCLGLLLFLTLFIVESSAQENPMIDSLQLVLKSTEADSSKVRLLNQLSSEYSNSDPAKALELAEEALALATRVKFNPGIAKAYYQSGVAHHSLNNFSKAREYYNLSIGLNKDIGDKAQYAYAVNALGTLYSDEGEYSSALSKYVEAQRIFEELNIKRGIGITLVNLANIYNLTGDYKNALTNYLKCLENFKQRNETKLIPIILGNISSVYAALKDYDKAIDFGKQAFDAASETGDKYTMSNACINLGFIYLNREEYKPAREQFSKALEISRQINNNDGITTALIDLGQVEHDLGNFAGALKYYSEAVDISEKTGLKSALKSAYLGMAIMYDTLNDPKRAFKYHKLYTYVKDSLYNEENSRNITQMQARYESERKDNEILLLNKDNQMKEANINRQRIVLSAVSIGMVLLLVLAFFIYRNYRDKKKANDLLETKNREINEQKEIIEEKNKDITDSIRYAFRIQQAIIPSEPTIQKHLPQSFVLYKPKDIVSGDFYWMETFGDLVLIAAVDCTGHGVPGALMSTIGYSILNQAVKEKKLSAPADILAFLNKGVYNTLQQQGADQNMKDGMDIAVCALNTKTNEMQYAGAFNPLYIIENGELKETKADKKAIGDWTENAEARFTNHTFNLSAGSMIYIFSDGYADQFGGPDQKKFKYAQLKKLLITIHDKPVSEQKAILNSTLENWKGKLEQVDDVLVMGVRV